MNNSKYSQQISLYVSEFAAHDDLDNKTYEKQIEILTWYLDVFRFRPNCVALMYVKVAQTVFVWNRENHPDVQSFDSSEWRKKLYLDMAKNFYARHKAFHTPYDFYWMKEVVEQSNSFNYYKSFFPHVKSRDMAFNELCDMFDIARRPVNSEKLMKLTYLIFAYDSREGFHDDFYNETLDERFDRVAEAFELYWKIRNIDRIKTEPKV